MRELRQSTVLYDADCGLCSSAVAFVRGHARADSFRFVPLAAPEAAGRLADGPPPGNTLILFEPDGRHDRSNAALRIAAQLRRPWSWLSALRVVPRALRDRIYDFIAKRRFNGFGPAPACRPGSRCPHPGRR